MTDSYESPMAATLTAIAHAALGRVGAAAELASAVNALRRVDAKAMLSTALNLCAEHAFEAGDAAGALGFAQEALQAATAVEQKSQQALARALLARLAASTDGAAARHYLDAMAAALADPRAISARARAAVERARAEICG